MSKSVTCPGLYCLTALLALALVCIACAAPASASDRIRWPSQTYVAPAKSAGAGIGAPRWIDKPSQSQEHPALDASRPTIRPTRQAAVGCMPSEVCVKCVANCDERAPTIVQKLEPSQVTAARPATGPPDHAIGHGRWNAIRCYEGGGCSATGVAAPRRIERSSDGAVTYFRIW